MAYVHTVRERELAFALAHAIEYLEEFGGDTRWHRNVLNDSLWPGEKVLADETVEAEEVVAETASGTMKDGKLVKVS